MTSEPVEQRHEQDQERQDDRPRRDGSDVELARDRHRRDQEADREAARRRRGRATHAGSCAAGTRGARPRGRSGSRATKSWPDPAAIARKQDAAIAATPTRRPFMLSMKLAALVANTTNRIVTRDVRGGPRHVGRDPDAGEHEHDRGGHLGGELDRRERAPRRSSIHPTNSISAAPSRIANTWRRLREHSGKVLRDRRRAGSVPLGVGEREREPGRSPGSRPRRRWRGRRRRASARRGPCGRRAGRRTRARG